MESTKTQALRQSSRWPLIVVGFVAGAAVGVIGHLAGLDRWALVPICAGIGGGVGSGFSWLLAWLSRGSFGTKS